MTEEKHDCKDCKVARRMGKNNCYDLAEEVTGALLDVTYSIHEAEKGKIRSRLADGLGISTDGVDNYLKEREENEGDLEHLEKADEEAKFSTTSIIRGYAAAASKTALVLKVPLEKLVSDMIRYYMLEGEAQAKSMVLEAMGSLICLEKEKDESSPHPN